MVKLATPTFLSGPQDDLASVDVYAQQSADVVNSIQELAEDHDLSVYDSLRAADFKALSEAAVLQNYNPLKGLGVNKDSLIARLTASSESLMSGLRGMDDSLVGSIGAAIPGGSQLLAKVGGIVSAVKSADLKNLTSIGRTISNITGNPSLFTLQDIGAQVGLYSGIIREATKLGIPNSFGSLMEGVANPAIVRQVALQALPHIVGTSDIHSLAAMAEQLSAGNVQHMMPQVVGEFAQQYTRTVQGSVSDKKEDWTTIQDSFDQIDPQWNTCQRVQEDGSVEEVVSLHNLTSASAELRESSTMAALSSSDPDQQLMALANVYPPADVDEHLSREFPQTDLGWDKRVVSNPTDPVALNAVTAVKSEAQELEDWALTQPGGRVQGSGRTRKVYVGDRLIYDAALNEWDADSGPTAAQLPSALPAPAANQLRDPPKLFVPEDSVVMDNGVTVYHVNQDGTTANGKDFGPNDFFARNNKAWDERKQQMDSKWNDSAQRDGDRSKW